MFTFIRARICFFMKKIESWKEISHEWADKEETHYKSDIAISQLRTAIWLFLNEIDYASAITLAGAAGEILHQLVVFSNKAPLLEKTRLFCKELIGAVPKREKYLKHFGDLTGVNSLKHKSKTCPDSLIIDLKKSAETALTRAVLDFMTLYGDKDPTTNAFMNHLWVTLDGPKMTAEFKTLKDYKALPKKAWEGVNPVDHRILDLATDQLRSSIFLFYKGDLYSSITLAGATDVLLCRLVENKGLENFTEHVLKSENDPSKTREQMGREINDMFHINALKHMDHKDDTTVTMNLRAAAVGAILKALPNYKDLRGNKEDFVKSFLAWIKVNLDPEVYNVDCDPNWKPKPEC